jgi:ABC-type Fe3+/spermidine/putrescine transport system ATPase subunit
VASFVGAMNVLPAVAVGPRGEVTLGEGAPAEPALAGLARVTLAIRPEDVGLAGSPPAGPVITLPGVVTKTAFAGREAYCHVEVEGGRPLLTHLYRPHERALPSPGERVTLSIPLARLHAFGDDERRIERPA